MHLTRTLGTALVLQGLSTCRQRRHWGLWTRKEAQSLGSHPAPCASLRKPNLLNFDVCIDTTSQMTVSVTVHTGTFFLFAKTRVRPKWHPSLESLASSVLNKCFFLSRLSALSFGFSLCFSSGYSVWLSFNSVDPESFVMMLHLLSFNKYLLWGLLQARHHLTCYLFSRGTYIGSIERYFQYLINIQK